MKYYQLDPEEKQISEDYDNGNFEPVKNGKKEVLKAKEVAKNTLDKVKNINIRLSYKDLQRLKVKAVESGIPYQTLVASILHQFVNEKIEVKL